ncbi:MAG TPA: 23S rRNA (adenine(2503)-C(2))-methyltransferase RlmN [Nitrospiria bacterium]
MGAICITNDFKEMSLASAQKWVQEQGWPRYRAEQIFEWIYRKGAKTFSDMTNLSKQDREHLEVQCEISRLKIIKHQISQDGTEKFLFILKDKNQIESVLIPDEDRLTLCISSQAGCGLDCQFCFTAVGGLKRNLKPHEIVDQVLIVKQQLSENRTLTNIVLMGMGEPLANLDNTLEAIQRITDPKGLAISPRRITISTVGLVPQIQDLGKRAPQINLAVSLNATTNEQRNRLVPINQSYPLEKLLQACKEFPLSPRRRIFFEYVLLNGVNDSLEDAKRLVQLVRGIRCKINLIPFNEYPGSFFSRPAQEQVIKFQNILLSANLTAFIRKTKGQDILAACGQLVGKSSDLPEPIPLV